MFERGNLPSVVSYRSGRRPPGPVVRYRRDMQSPLAAVRLPTVSPGHTKKPRRANMGSLSGTSLSGTSLTGTVFSEDAGWGMPNSVGVDASVALGIDFSDIGDPASQAVKDANAATTQSSDSGGGIFDFLKKLGGAIPGFTPTPAPVIVQQAGMSTTTKLALAGGAALLIVLLARRSS